MKDPYAVLGLEKTSAPELLKEKYEKLRALYGEQRFKSGEEGNEGARKLQELEEAWIVISADIEKTAASPTGDEYAHIDELIRAGKYNEAQSVLDSITERKGEWHYMQAMAFNKREWLTESKSQLEMALQDDPGNAKYRASLDKLNMTISRPAQPKTNGATVQAPPEEQPVPAGQADNMSNCLSSCCCAYCLTDCLCTALRCM